MNIRAKIAVIAVALATAASMNAAACTPPLNTDNLGGCAYLNGVLPLPYPPELGTRRALEAEDAQAAVWRVADAAVRGASSRIFDLSAQPGWWWVVAAEAAKQGLELEANMFWDEMQAMSIEKHVPQFHVSPYTAHWLDSIETLVITPRFRIELEVIGSFEHVIAALHTIRQKIDAFSTDWATPVHVSLDKASTTSGDNVLLQITISTRTDDSTTKPLTDSQWPIGLCFGIEKIKKELVESEYIKPSEPVTPHFSRLMRFALDGLGQHGNVVALEFEQVWAKSKTLSGTFHVVTPASTSAWSREATYNLDVTDQRADAEPPHGETATAVVSGITPFERTFTSSRGAVNDAIGFVRYVEGLERLSNTAVNLTMINEGPSDPMTGSSSAHAQLTWAAAWMDDYWSLGTKSQGMFGDDRSSFEVSPTGRRKPRDTAQAIIDRVEAVVQIFADLGLTSPELESASVDRHGAWSVRMTRSGCPITDDFDALASLLSKLGELGVGANGDQRLDGGARFTFEL